MGFSLARECAKKRGRVGVPLYGSHPLIEARVIEARDVQKNDNPTRLPPLTMIEDKTYAASDFFDLSGT